MRNRQGKEETLPIWTVVKSVISALFGIQSEQNLKRDINQAGITPYILVGILLIVFFVLSLLGLISLITAQ